MGPQPEGRGERASRNWNWTTPGGFNGATARRPWRTALQRLTEQVGQDRFNGATARRPWRTTCSVSRWSARHSGFNGATARRPWRTPVGQCAATPLPSFNGATARRPWRTPTNRIVPQDAGGLQWGHSPKAVENRRWSLLRRRVLGRFNGATARRPWRTAGRAGLGSRGDRRLQWGHSPKAVENRSRSKPCISRWLERTLRAGGLLEGNTESSRRSVIG